MQQFLISITLCILINTPFKIAYSAQPEPMQDVINRAISQKLYQNTIWLNLLKYQKTGENSFKSEIITPEFFLSEIDHNSPEQEMIATLLEISQPATSDSDSNQHAQCRFPARTHWLKSELSIPETLLPEIKCKKLDQWADFKHLDSINLVMVSGYFGNPASTFGHNLIKINNSKYSTDHHLLDLGINFGATVPDNEPTLIYILKGIFGGYAGGFSDRTFYTQDTLYRETQFRDMWEYELNLDNLQKRFLIYHLWELVGNKYIYYFLKENCGYRIAELLEIITGKNLVNRKRPWFLPVEVFHNLDNIDRGNNQFIKQVTYIPSSQRLLYDKYQKLNNKESQQFNKFLTGENSKRLQSMSSVTVEQQQRIYNLLLDYYQYKLAAFDDDAPEELENRKNEVLRMRLTLPASVSKPEPVKIIEAPSEGSKPSNLQVGISYNQNHDAYTSLAFSAVHYDVLGIQYGSLSNATLKVASAKVGVHKDEKAFLDYLDLLNIQKIQPDTTNIPGEDNKSWRIRLGTKRKNLGCLDCQMGNIEGGMGRAFNLSKNAIGYGMIDTSLKTAGDTFNIMPGIGLITENSPSIKSAIEFRQQLNQSNKNGKPIINFKTRYAFSVNQQIRIQYQYDRDYEVSLNYHLNL